MTHDKQHTRFRVAIVGGGASGLACAAELVQACKQQGFRPPEIRLFEASRRIGAPIMRSGNGRCNFSHKPLLTDGYRNRSFVGQALAQGVSVTDWFERLGLVWQKTADGLLYPYSNKAASVLDVLLYALQDNNVTVLENAAVSAVEAVEAVELESEGAIAAAEVAEAGGLRAAEGTSEPQRGSVQQRTSEPQLALEPQPDVERQCASERQRVTFNITALLQEKDQQASARGKKSGRAARAQAAQRGSAEAQSARTVTWQADAVVLACGGNPRVLPALAPALKQIPQRPVLGPIETSPKPLAGLNGVRVRARVSVPERSFAEVGEVLFRPYGVSGIVVFNASRYAQAGDSLVLDLFPDKSQDQLVQLLSARFAVLAPCSSADFFRGMLDGQVARAALKQAHVPKDKPLVESKLVPLAHALKHVVLTVKGVAEGQNCQVHRGGIAVEEVSSHTMEANRVPGLYVTGEALDVDAPCGGYNLHWAWTSGIIAARSIVAGLS